jgi:hypothetical protein
LNAIAQHNSDLGIAALNRALRRGNRQSTTRTDDILPVIKKCRQSGIIVTAGKPPIIITKFNAATAIGMPGGRNNFRAAF